MITQNQTSVSKHPSCIRGSCVRDSTASSDDVDKSRPLKDHVVAVLLYADCGAGMEQGCGRRKDALRPPSFITEAEGGGVQ